MSGTKKGTFVLCIDVELAWGLVHKQRIDSYALARVCETVRKVLGSVVDTFEKYRIPVTWAILGHIMLDHCEGVSGKAHPEMPRAKYSWLKKDWYRYDPCTTVRAAPAWYGKDIVDHILSYVKTSSLPHDIACHSFSHQMFGDPDCSREVAEAEVKKCREIMKKEYNLVPKVFAFPRDYVGHLDVLKENGFIAFRDTIPKLYPCLKLEKTVSNLVNTSISLFVQGLSYYIISPPHVVVPRLVHNLWTVPGCLAYGKKPMIPFRLVTLKAIKGIDSCIQKGNIFCMYTHLIEFALHRNALSEFERILSYADEKKRDQKLSVKTIKEIATELETQYQ